MSESSASLAAEFQRVRAYWDERMNAPDWARNETWRARDEVVAFLMRQDNRDRIARALRRDEPIADDVLDAVSRKTGFATSVVVDILRAFREAVQ